MILESEDGDIIDCSGILKPCLLNLDFYNINLMLSNKATGSVPNIAIVPTPWGYRAVVRSRPYQE